MQFWCTYCGLRFRPRPLFWFWACKCCMYVRLEAHLSVPVCSNASGGWPQPCFGSNITPPSQTGMVNTRPVCVDDILAAVCHAPTNGPGSPTAQLQHVESLLRDEWERPLEVIIPTSRSQQYTLEARHLRDAYSKSYVTDSAEIVVYYWWLTRTALSADWDVMGVVWVVRDSLWNASSVPLGRRLVLGESWALCTLKATSIDMVYAPPLLAAQIYNLRNEHWVMRLLLVSPTHMFLCLVFDPLCNKLYIAGANTEELAIVNLIAEREGIRPRPQKRWDRFLGEFGRLWLLREIAQAALHYRDSPHAPPIETTPSWALAQMYATPYCSPSRSSCFFCDDTAHITCPECGVYQCALQASGLCPSEICVALRNWRVQFTATLACIVLAFSLGDRLVVDKPPSVDEVRPKVVIRGKGNAMHAMRTQCEVLDVGKYSNPSFGPLSQVFGSVPGFFWLPKHLGCGIFELSTISP